MKNIILFFVLFTLFTSDSFSQQLPLGTCGIVNIYDAAGNRTKRVYFCNNGQEYPSKQTVQENETMEFQYVDALYPNPTTGKVSITFSKTLQNAQISIMDNTGKIISRFKASGNKVDFDLSRYSAGVYYVRIEEDGKSITKKVVKQ